LSVLLDENSEGGARNYAFAQVYGGQAYPYDYHKNGFTARKLLNLTKFVPGQGDATVEEENDGQNLKLTATLLFRPEYESIGTWWNEIQEMQRPKLPELNYEDPGDAELPPAPQAEAAPAPEKKEKPAPKKKPVKKPVTGTTTTGNTAVRAGAWDNLPKNGTK
jgi:hypothetical protein